MQWLCRCKHLRQHEQTSSFVYSSLTHRIYQKVYLLLTNSLRCMNIPDESLCIVCNRPLAGICNKHHLLPRSKGGKNTPTILLHKICHDKIQAVFTETELKRYYNTIEKLQQNEEMQKFIKWVYNKEPEFYDNSVKGKVRRTK